MSPSALLKPTEHRVNRSKLRQAQSTVLKQASGRTVIVVENRGEGDAKCILDKNYFDALLAQLSAAFETLEITTNVKLFKRLLKTAQTVEKDTRLGKLYSIEDVFGEP